MMTTNLQEIISKTKAIPSGSGWYSCLCPFHDDHHPSMAFNEKNYVCYTCGTIGPLDELVTRLKELEGKNLPGHPNYEHNHDKATLHAAVV